MEPSKIADGPRKRAKTALFVPPVEASTWAARQEGSRKVAATGKQKGKAHRGDRMRAAAVLLQLPVEKGFRTQTLWLARDTPDAQRFPLRKDGRSTNLTDQAWGNLQMEMMRALKSAAQTPGGALPHGFKTELCAWYTINVETLSRRDKTWEKTANLLTGIKAGRPTLLDSPLRSELKRANSVCRGRGAAAIAQNITVKGGMYRGKQADHPSAMSVRKHKKTEGYKRVGVKERPVIKSVAAMARRVQFG